VLNEPRDVLSRRAWRRTGPAARLGTARR
jgi:hypothetical protein